MPHTPRITTCLASAILATTPVLATAGPSHAATTGTPLTPIIQTTTRDTFACGQGPGGLKMTMQSNREMSQACAKAGEVANAYAAAPQQAGEEQAVSVNVDGANWACVHKTEMDEAYVECSHADETLSLSEFRSMT
ncbi:hypothetical protein [Nonomuraea candida]|uniref:hypothetical protein n=1 Tax=Nonomuraea candida TaxID=359159 RepID=UPI000AEE4116|nr:hypothetical protein [Nonomuraea candida]